MIAHRLNNFQKDERLLNGVNNPEDIVNVDPLSFQIHGPKKAMFYMALKLVKPIPIEVIEQCESPLSQALIRIYKKYLSVEKQEWRRDLYIRIIPFMILLLDEDGDPNHSEVFQWFVYELWKEMDAGNVEFPLNHLLSFNWWSESKPGRNWINIEIEGKRTTNKIIEGGII